MLVSYRRILLTAGFVFFAAFTHASKEPLDHKQWSDLLAQNVTPIRGGKSTEVDYEAFSKESQVLDKYLNAISAVKLSDFEAWGKNEQLAFLINTYNAFTVKLIIDGDKDIDSIKDLGSLFKSPWKQEFIPLFGSTVSLDHVEHELIRGSGKYNEPRIHFAVNCASIGCPSLRGEAFVADKLEQQLEEQTKSFLNDETRNVYSDDTVTVSSIFKWYRADFEQGWRDAYSLHQFLALYSKDLGLNKDQEERLNSEEVKVKFGKYDWNLNRKQ